MNKLTKMLAAGITSIIAVSAFSVPAFAAESESLEQTLCDAAASSIDDFTDLVAEVTGLLTERGDAVDTARSTMDASTEDVANAALAYIQALDGDGDEEATFDAFLEAAVDFSEDVTDWLDAVDDQTETVKAAGIYNVNLDYLTGICGAPPA